MNYTKVIDEIFRHIHGVRFDIHLWDDQIFEYGSGDKIAFKLYIADEPTAQRLISQGSLGFGESFMNGRLRIEGDLEAYLRIRHQFKSIKATPRLALAALLSSKNSPTSRQDQISHHYDIGNDFFQLILDQPTMSYSSGYYDSGRENLRAAQLNKLELMCDWLELPPGATVLDLGSGWGGFAIYAAQKRGWNITGLTLSRQQQTYCDRLIKAKSLDTLISIDYKDMTIDLPDEKFDAIVMLESIEHVGKQQLPIFIHKLHDRLKPGGRIYIQATGRYISKPLDKWTLEYVFPGGYLPAKQELEDAAEQAGLEIVRFVDDTSSYVKTMSEWILNLEKNRQLVEAKYDSSFYLLWNLWMHGAKVAFETDSMNLFRIIMRRSDEPGRISLLP
ncbi:MAG: cyclopropane-fatty-acyl-phospholipid synthase family protein [Candidatus Saccharibacteria bacterium]